MRITLTGAALVILVCIGFSYGLQLDVAMRSILYTDFGKFYQTLQFAQHHQNLYTPVKFLNTLPEGSLAQVIPKWNFFAPDLNPPFFTFLISPFGLVNYSIAIILWSLFSIVCGVIAILLIVRTLFPAALKYLPVLLAVIAAFFAFLPSHVNIQYGQVGILLALPVVCAWLAARANKTWLAALILAVLTQVKPFFGLFAIYFLCHKEWRAFSIYTLSCIVILLFSLFYYGLATHLDYYSVLSQVRWYSSNWNASLLGWLLRLFGGNDEKTPPIINLPHMAAGLYWLFSLALFAIFIRLLRSNHYLIKSKKVDLDFSCALVVSLLISPFGWLYYFPILLVPLACLFYYVKESVYPLSLLLLTFVIIALINFPVPLVPMEMIRNARAVFLWSSIYTGALILLLVGLFIVAKTTKPSQPSSALLTPIMTFSLAFVSFLPSLLGILVSSLCLIQQPADYLLVILSVATGS